MNNETFNGFDYEFLNRYNGTRSPTGTVEYDFTTGYFFRSLYQRALSIIDFKLPEGWNKRYFKNVLFGLGFIGIIRTPEYGIIPQICSPSGYGLYLQPVEMLVAQPLVNFQGRIGDNCALIRITPDYMGIMDIIEHYARLLAICYTSIDVSMINARLAYIGYSDNKAGAEALKVIAEKVSQGEPFIFVDKAIKSDALDSQDPIFSTLLDPAKNYVSDKLLNDFTTILNQFDREIGIPIVDNKKERMLNAEVTALTSDAGTRLDTWTDCLDETIAECKNVFPEIDITYTTRREVSGIGTDNVDRNV